MLFTHDHSDPAMLMANLNRREGARLQLVAFSSYVPRNFALACKLLCQRRIEMVRFVPVQRLLRTKNRHSRLVPLRLSMADYSPKSMVKRDRVTILFRGKTLVRSWESPADSEHLLPCGDVICATKLGKNRLRSTYQADIIFLSGELSRVCPKTHCETGGLGGEHFWEMEISR